MAEVNLYVADATTDRIGQGVDLVATEGTVINDDLIDQAGKG